MAKITNKYDKYYEYLSTLTQRLQTEQTIYNKKIETYSKIRELLSLESSGKSIPNSAYNALAMLDCPDYDSIEFFNGEAEFGPTEVVTTSADRLLFICPNVSCQTCWKNFINNIVNTINKSNNDVKNFNTHLDSDDIILTNEEEQLMEQEYLTYENLLDIVNNTENQE